MKNFDNKNKELFSGKITIGKLKKIIDKLSNDKQKVYIFSELDRKNIHLMGLKSGELLSVDEYYSCLDKIIKYTWKCDKDSIKLY